MNFIKKQSILKNLIYRNDNNFKIICNKLTFLLRNEKLIMSRKIINNLILNISNSLYKSISFMFLYNSYLVIILNTLNSFYQWKSLWITCRINLVLYYSLFRNDSKCDSKTCFAFIVVNRFSCSFRYYNYTYKSS